ncbi:uncharacterized protein METZ01_LOCUS274583 [marine metagenome]|uniref:Uncharacterized protein n=1 Tax=marine metagenome TaxID=408172 RepID=A0A382KC25_9ZZZZ
MAVAPRLPGTGAVVVVLAGIQKIRHKGVCVLHALDGTILVRSIESVQRS